MQHDARWARRSRGRQRAEDRRALLLEQLVELDARCAKAAAAAALLAATVGRGPRWTHRAS